MRKVFETTYRNKSAIVVHDREWSDYIVRYYHDNKHLAEADSHHYDDKDDAISTAKHFVAH